MKFGDTFGKKGGNWVYHVRPVPNRYEAEEAMNAHSVGAPLNSPAFCESSSARA